jgi:hypothetical protein
MNTGSKDERQMLADIHRIADSLKRIELQGDLQLAQLIDEDERRERIAAHLLAAIIGLDDDVTDRVKAQRAARVASILIEELDAVAAANAQRDLNQGPTH